MNPHPERRLLGDILHEERESIRRETYTAALKELGRRKKKRYLPVSWAIAAAVTIAAAIFFVKSSVREEPQQASSRPVVTNAFLVTAKYAPMPVVMSRSLAIATVDSEKYRARIVDNTSTYEPVGLISDAELLALFPNESGGLISGPDGRLRLVFLDSPRNPGILHLP